MGAMANDARHARNGPDADGEARMPLLAGRPGTIRGLGYDEHWLQDWLAADPSRLGLGDVAILDQEQTQAGGGLLDLLALDRGSETYYSIEVQLGEIDGSHSFRVFDYWARNRDRLPGKDARRRADGRERQRPLPRSTRGVGGDRAADRDRTALLARGGRGRPDPRDRGCKREPRSQRDAGRRHGRRAHRSRLAPASQRRGMGFQGRAFVRWVEQSLGSVRVDYKPKSYIGLRVGRRVWAPLWLRQDGATIYLPDPDGSRSDEPSLAFEGFEPQLSEAGITAAWVPNYNAKANPVSLRLRRADLELPIVQQILRASYEILQAGAQPWSQRNAAAETNESMADKEITSAPAATAREQAPAGA